MTDVAGFTAQLQAEGYQEVVTREIKAGLATPEHTHPYDARGLVLAGQFCVTSATGAQDCGVGQSFAVAAGLLHAETSGAAGATLLVGRRSLG